MKNFTLSIAGLFIFFVLPITRDVWAEELNFSAIHCGQFKYTNIITLSVDLNALDFEMERASPNQKLGEGQIGKVKQCGIYVTFKLYENSKYVGFLKATEAGQRDSIGTSILYYKGKTYEGYDGLFCHFKNQ